VSYKVDRRLGYAPWGVTNPWVFADLSQPQRYRGPVSPVVWQTHTPMLRQHPLGQTSTSTTTVDDYAARMEQYTILGLAISASSLMFLVWYSLRRPTLRENRMGRNRGRGKRVRRNRRRR